MVEGCLLTEEEIQDVARIAREVGAVRFGEFTLASGRKSDFYFDGRRLTLHQRALAHVARAMSRAMAGATCVGGPATAAVPMVAGYLSHYVGAVRRGFYVRQEPKAHGLGNLIEGLLEKGDRVLLVDDTLTTGGSLIKAASAVAEAGAEVVGVMTLMDRCEGGADAVRERLGVPVSCGLTRRALESAIKRVEESLAHAMSEGRP